MSIPTDELRRFAAGDPKTLPAYTVQAVCTELLACREELAMAIDARDGAERASRRQFNDIRALTRERDAARAEAEKLRTELDEAVNAELAHKAKWESICSASRENGTCACSYDSIDDVCMAHSPKLAAAMADLAAARSEAEHERRAGQEMTAGLHEKLAEVRAELAAVKRQRDELLRAAKAWQSVFGDADGSEPVVIDLRNAAVFDLFTAFVDTLAAEQPKPQDPEVQP